MQEANFFDFCRRLPGRGGRTSSGRWRGCGRRGSADVGDAGLLGARTAGSQADRQAGDRGHCSQPARGLLVIVTVA